MKKLRRKWQCTNKMMNKMQFYTVNIFRIENPKALEPKPCQIHTQSDFHQKENGK